MLRESALREVTAAAARDAEVVVVACGLDRHQRAYAVDGLRRRARCHFLDALEELERYLGAAVRCDVVVLAPQDPGGRSTLPVVERLVRYWPETAIVLFCPRQTDQGTSLRSFVLAGIHQAVFEGVHDTASALALAVDAARRECAGDRVQRELAPLVPRELHSIVSAVLSLPERMTTVAVVANRLGVHRKTLVNRCARTGFLQPGELVMWCRLALVAHFLERSGATVESLALTLGFASHTSLRNLVKRYTGMRATDVRERGGLSVLLDALSARIAARPTRSLPIT